MAELQTHHLNGIERQISQLGNITQAVSRQVDTVQTQQAEMDSRLSTLADQFQAFLRADALAKELNLAETRLTTVRQELESEFGHYNEVRRRTTGLLQALDTEIVSHETIQDTTEEVMVASPRYWLAPALVALAAWSRDDRPLAQQALAEALRRDVAKTSLFLSLVLRRHERPAATRWLGQFFARQDPTSLGREFIVVLDAVATGAYGVGGRTMITDEVTRWLEELQHQSGFFDAQVTRWREAIFALRPSDASKRYPYLEANSPTWPALADALMTARLHARVTAHFSAIFEGELTVPPTIEAEMDAILDRLVRDFDEEELPLRRREAELQAIIEHDGDKVAAAATVKQAHAALDERVDFPSMLTNAAMRPKETGASRGSERLAVAMSREWIVRAYDEITVEARDAVPSRIELSFEGWKGVVEEGTDADGLVKSLRAHVDRETEAQVKAVRFTGMPLAAAIGGTIALIGGLVALSVVLIAIGLAGVGYGVWDYFQLDKRRAAVRKAGEDRKQRGTQVLNAMLAEIVDYHSEWESEDGHAEEARSLLTAISPVDQLSAPAHDAREVL